MGRPRGSEGYNKDDTKALLAVLKAVLPYTQSDWDVVLEQYRSTHASPNGRALRDVDSLRNKFRGLLYRKDDAGVVSEVQDARAVQAAIKAKGKGARRASLQDQPVKMSTASAHVNANAGEPDAQRLLATRSRLIQARPDVKKRRVGAEAGEQDDGAESASSIATDPANCVDVSAARPVAILPRPLDDQRSSRVSISELTQLGKRVRGEQQSAGTAAAQNVSPQDAAGSNSSGDSSRFLEYLLALEKEEKANERHERQLLAQKLERVEKTCAMLRDKMDDVRESHKAVQLENVRLQGELSTLRAVQSVQGDHGQ